MQFFSGLVSLLFLIVIGLAVAVTAVFVAFQAPGPLSSDAFITIERGTGVRGIADRLTAEGAIMHPHPFMAGAKLMNGGKPLQAGEYQIKAEASMADILAMMQSGAVYHRFFTIPEGRTSYEIVKILYAVAELDGEITDIPPEGSLLPETYAFMAGDERAEKIARMQEAMNETLAAAWEIRAPDLPFQNPEEALILASIVEKETGVPDEYAKVAGVFVNRLRIGMPLQTDPTVIYGMTLGRHEDEGQGPLGRRLLRSDLEKDTPYNTYTRPGLPPTPISNPGRAAIEAVMNPASHDYLYFVADGTGGHAFGKTLAEHNANVAKWRKIRNAR